MVGVRRRSCFGTRGSVATNTAGNVVKNTPFLVGNYPKMPQITNVETLHHSVVSHEKYLAVSRLHVETRAVNIIYLFFFLKHRLIVLYGAS